MFGNILPCEPITVGHDAAAIVGPPLRPSPALQRTFGTIDLVFSSGLQETKAMRAFQKGALRARFPNHTPGQPPEAVLLNLAGGLTGGDRLDIAVRLQARASAVVTSQTCEKIYRSPGNDAIMSVQLRLAEGADLDWLPQATIMYDGARLRRETHVELEADSRLLAVEAVIFGRTAHGEEVRRGALSDSWTIHRSGRLIHADCFEFCGEGGVLLHKPAVLDGRRAMATMRYIAPDSEVRLQDVRSLLTHADADERVIAAASAWNGLLVVRFAALDSYALNRALARTLEGFRGKRLPKVWSI